MITEERRKQILNMLIEKGEPITGTELAKIFQVSRQIIVQDIAVIRAQGENVLATSSGYMLQKPQSNKNIVTLVCRHEGYESLEEELKIMVDSGAKILDVIVEHPVYGEIRSALMIQSRLELDEFMEKLQKNHAAPLATLTGGEHIHTLEVPSKKAYERIVQELTKKGYLVEE